MSHINIFPPVATIYPNDRQIFTVRAVPPPALWRAVSDSGDIKSDFSLEVDAAGSTVSGIGGHRLFSGIGIVELTVDDQCLPTGANLLILSGFIVDVNGLQYFYSLRIDSDSLEVRDELNNQLFTEVYSTLSGDVYRLELNAGFRFYRKDAGETEFVLKHSRVGLASVVVYPMTYQMAITEPTAAAPTRIPAPRLIGDWRLNGAAVVFTAPSHGSLTTVGFGQTEYSGGTLPGVYTLIGAMEASADAGNVQRATARINIPALQILGETEVTLQPGQKMRPKTNYDAAQTALVTWSALSGLGTFTQGEYTAGSPPGPAIIRAFADVNDQVADITVNVPATITNANGYTAAKASEQIDFNTNITAIPYLVSSGPLGHGTGDVTFSLPPGFAKDDIMLLVVETANEAVAAPSGWVAVADSPQGTGTAGGAASARLSIFWKRAVVSEALPVVTDPGDHVQGKIYAFRGCITTGNPWDVTAGDVAAAATTAVSIPGDTTTVDNCLIVAIVANATDTQAAQVSGFANADLANFAERDDFNWDDGNGGGIAIATGEKAVAGAYGATTATLATASVQGRMSIALKPQPPFWTQSATGGAINSSTGVFTAPSLAGQTAKITVENGVARTTIEVPILEVFPFTDLSLPINRDRNLNALVGMSEDRSKRVTREKASPHDSYEVKLTARSLDDVEAVDAFFDSHGFGKLFILEDLNRGLRKVGWFDSAIRHESRDECDNDMSFRFLEARL